MKLLLLLFATFNLYAQAPALKGQDFPFKNVLKNGGFENGRVGWDITGTCSQSLSVEIPYYNRALKLECNDQEFSVKQNVDSITDLSGQPYRASVLVKIEGAHTNTVEVVTLNDDNDSFIRIAKPSDNFKRYSIPDIITSTSSGIEVRTATTITATVYIDDVQLYQTDTLFESFETQTTELRDFAAFGSTDTRIVRFNEVHAESGSGIYQVETTAASGTTITFLKDAHIDMAWIGHTGTTAASAGITKNSENLTQNVTSAANKLVTLSLVAANTNGVVIVPFNGKVKAGDVLRAHTNTSGNENPDRWRLSIKATPLEPTLLATDFCQDLADCTTIFSAKVSSAGVVSDENVHWIDGDCTNPSTGVYECPVKSGFFSQVPNCKIAHSEQPQGSIETTTSTTTINYSLRNSAGSLVNGAAGIFCQRQGQDYENAKTPVIVGKFSASHLQGGVDYGGTNKMISGWASFGGSTDGSACNSSPCTRYREAGNSIVSNGMSATRADTGRYDLTSTGWKVGTNVKCNIEGEGRLTTPRPSDFAADSSGEIVFRIESYIPTSGIPYGDAYFIVDCTGEKP